MRKVKSALETHRTKGSVLDDLNLNAQELLELKLKAGLLEKALVIGIVRHGRQLSDRLQGAQPPEIYIEKAVCAGQKASGFGGSAAA